MQTKVHIFITKEIFLQRTYLSDIVVESLHQVKNLHHFKNIKSKKYKMKK